MNHVSLRGIAALSLLAVGIGVVGCGGGGHATLPAQSPSAFASKAKAAGCEARSSGDGEYIMCDDETYTAVPQGGGSFIGCDKAGDSKCQEKVEKIAK